MDALQILSPEILPSWIEHINASFIPLHPSSIFIVDTTFDLFLGEKSKVPVQIIPLSRFLDKENIRSTSIYLKNINERKKIRACFFVALDIYSNKKRFVSYIIFFWEDGSFSVVNSKKGYCRFKICSMCTEAKPLMSKCAGCLVVRYCSDECQKKDWPRHKKFCRKKDKK